jgi:hypothetical protein
MSLIQIADLDHFSFDSFVVLADMHSATIFGGISAPVAPTSIISPYTSASSISISSFSKNNILDVAANTKFNTSFTVDTKSVKPTINGSIELQLGANKAKFSIPR